jgi:mono/diheme cytochrome c family protein
MSRSNVILAISVVLCCASVVAHGQRAVASARVEPASRESGDLPSGAGADVARARCTACHGPALIVQQRLSPEGWGREVDKMVGWGAVVNAADRAVLLNYLSTAFGVRTPSAVAGTEATGPTILRTRCQSCHDLHLVEQQRLDAAGWRREVEKMVGWGAVLNDSERDALVGYLAGRLP